MSDGLIVLCHKVLVLFFLVFHAKAIINNPWSTSVGKNCYWKQIGNIVFELRDDLSFGNTSRMFASVSTIYDLKDDHEISGQFCIAFNLARSSGLELTLTINTNDKTYESAGNYDQCVPYSSTLVKVSFKVDCPTHSWFFNPRIKILRAYTINVHSSTSTSIPGGPTTPDVGDIQYVGVVVGAICIALFTLFSCLTIISARRSNQRDARQRAIPSVSCQEEDDNRHDVVADNAPPSYDAVMASPDRYPPTPQDTPRGTPETTPHLSLHRRTLLNQHMGSLPDSASVTPQLHRQSFTPTVASDEWDDVPEDPPPPYPGLGNGSVSVPVEGDDTIDNTTAVEDTRGVVPGIENPGVSHPGSAASSPNPNSPIGEQESPWVLNNTGHGHLRNRDSNTPSGGNIEQYPLRSRTQSGDSDQTNSQGESTSSYNDAVIDTTSESAQDRGPKPIAESRQQNNELRVAVV